MHLEFKQFQPSNFPEYAAWFTDPELDRWLGPLDAEWLDAVLSERASDRTTYLVLDAETPVAVLETALHPENTALAAITGLAVKPDRRGQGVGTAVLHEVLATHRRAGRLEHLAYIYQDHWAAQRCFERAGFVRVTPTPNEGGYLEFRRNATRLLRAQGKLTL